MQLGHLSLLGAIAAALPLLSCHSVVEFDVAYKQCVPLSESLFVETFDDDEGFQNLTDRCWQTDHAGSTPQEVEQRLFGDDGDLVIRIGDGDEWSGAMQGPLVYTTVSGDFVAAARSESLNQGDGSHCLDPGNSAGFAVRKAAMTSEWATWTVEPHVIPGVTFCDEDEIPEKIPSATVSANSPTWSVPAPTDNVGEDGEADLAVCRLNGKLFFLYRDVSKDPNSQNWVTPNLATPSDVGTKDLEVGLTAGGKAPSFQASGHFNWVLLRRGVGSDGCAGTLKTLSLPTGS